VVVPVTFDYELILIKMEAGENDLGDPITVRSERPVLCDVLSVGRNEHYQAAAHGLKPELVFVVSKWDYDGEKEVEFEGKKYNVLRTYQPKNAKGLGDFETMELVCEGVVNRGNA
jgi:SPP1 family predicted phage head-tail adaptor